MYKRHDKLELAGQLLLEAARECRSATSDVGYAKSLLLAGAVENILTPYLDELSAAGSKPEYTPRQVEMARHMENFAGAFAGEPPSGDIAAALKFLRNPYNHLKHAGKDRGNDKSLPSEDLMFYADLRNEADWMVAMAIEDYSRLPLNPENLSGELLELLQSFWPIRAGREG
ncbi:hypothetical protein [Rugamonas apoptosis]|uniref:HEPN domain-containing protein n=1 Tax=Rugamonas apoptosis TaxID=2758570 RepID=A0A7W2IM45_9BURK|nr:hypothetical protein [Rugamonas apoptosis]MBA5689146.1 hypothetical protein [Rugamonas apoptosis]